jgi:hypothetical protein
MRLKNDQYFTPPEAVYPLLKILSLNVDDLTFEPCAGDGNITQCLRDDGHDELLWTGDIDYKLKGLTLPGFDATDRRQWANAFEKFNPDWVITNPPYKQPDCDRIIQNAWEFAEIGVAMLLRLTYLEPCQGRAKFLKAAPLSNLIILNPRPQFIPGKKSTDASTVAWFVWQKRHNYLTQITYCTDWNE